MSELEKAAYIAMWALAAINGYAGTDPDLKYIQDESTKGLNALKTALGVQP